jgi:hypothetical protein
VSLTKRFAGACVLNVARCADVTKGPSVTISDRRPISSWKLTTVSSDLWIGHRVTNA